MDFRIWMLSLSIHGLNPSNGIHIFKFFNTMDFKIRIYNMHFYAWTFYQFIYVTCKLRYILSPYNMAITRESIQVNLIDYFFSNLCSSRAPYVFSFGNTLGSDYIIRTPVSDYIIWNLRIYNFAQNLTEVQHFFSPNTLQTSKNTQFLTKTWFGVAMSHRPPNNSIDNFRRTFFF
jgi:hypothetical protein